MTDAINKFWMVHGIGTRGPIFRHETRASAASEAKRLSALQPGTTYVVLAAVSAFAAERPAIPEPKIVKINKSLGSDADCIDVPF